MYQPGGSQAWQDRICLDSDAIGSWSCNVDVRARIATGTGSAGAAWPVALAVSVMACWMLACP